jgi:protein-disulfide isomerase
MKTQLTLSVSERDHIQGPATAPITLVEYGDYECPYCGEAYPIVRQLQQELGERLRFVFRNFPLTTAHPHAQSAAEAAETAAAQDSFWEMHDLLFENQEKLDEADLIRYASKLALNLSRFKSELSAHTHAARVREDFMSGVRSGVNRTPTFFINGGRHDGSFDFDTLLWVMKRRDEMFAWQSSIR